MSEPENFLSRWSRRKQEADHADEEPHDASEAAHAPGETGVPADVPVQEAKAPEFDVSTLPSIDLIGVGTDIRSFLQKGVPLDLTRAALRRAWSTDPAIRDFIGIAENQWDFATGSDIPGFGPLEASDDVRRLVAEVFQGRVEVPLDKTAAANSEPPQQSVAQSQPAQRDSEPAAQQEAVANSDQQNLQPETSSENDEAVLHCKEENIASQKETEQSQNILPIKRTHGRALPQ